MEQTNIKTFSEIVNRPVNPTGSVGGNVAKREFTLTPLTTNVAQYGTPAYSQWIKKRAQEFITKKKLPFTTTPGQGPSYFDKQANPSKYFVYTMSSGNDHHQFTYGQMEAGRKIIWQSIKGYCQKYKKLNDKFMYAITPQVYNFLAYIDNQIREGIVCTYSMTFEEPPKAQSYTIVDNHIPHSPLHYYYVDIPTPQVAEISLGEVEMIDSSEEVDMEEGSYTESELNSPQYIKPALTYDEIFTAIDQELQREALDGHTIHNQYSYWCGHCQDYITFEGTEVEYFIISEFFCQIEDCNRCHLPHACLECSDFNPLAEYRQFRRMHREKRSHSPDPTDNEEFEESFALNVTSEEVVPEEDFNEMVDRILRENEEKVKLIEPLPKRARTEPIDIKYPPGYSNYRLIHPKTCQNIYIPVSTLEMFNKFNEISLNHRIRKFQEPLKADMEQTTIVEEQNVTFMDKRDEVEDNAYITSQIETKMQNVNMSEDEWHIRDILAKPIFVETIAWNTSHSKSTILKQYRVPSDFMKDPHKQIIGSFQFWRGHPKIRFQLNSTKFHWGRVIAAWVPMYSQKAYTDTMYNPSQLTSFPHVMLDAGISNSGELSIPFIHMTPYFKTTNFRAFNYLGQIVVLVFNQLGSTTTASKEVDISVWASYSNCELHMPCYSHTPQFPPNTLTDEPGDEENLKADASFEAVLKELPAITKSVGNVLGGASNCDKPTDIREIERWVPNTVTSLNFGDGIDRSNRLSLEHGSATLHDSGILATNVDDMNLRKILQIPTRLTTFKWQTAQGPGTLLRTIPNAPSNVESVYATGAFDVWNPTLLAYCCRAAKYWRGSLRYRVQLVASIMQTGRILIAFTPGYYSQQIATTSQSAIVIMDLQEKHEIEFVVPFMGELPWYRSDRLESIEQNTTSTSNASTGQINFHVLNRLACPDATSQEIDINVFVSAGEDFELAFIADLALARGIGNPPAITTEEGDEIKANALFSNTEVSDRTDNSPIILGKGSGMLPYQAHKTMSENIMDLKTILRRYYKVFDNNGIIEGRNVITFNNTPNLSSINQFFNDKKGCQNRTHLAHFSQLYTFWSGSLRYKFIMWGADKTKEFSVRVYHLPQCPNMTDFQPHVMTEAGRVVFSGLESMGEIIGVTNIQNSWEFEIPFYTPYHQLIVNSTESVAAYHATGSVVIQIVSPEKLNVHYELHQAAGDDFVLNYLRGAPRLLFQKDAEKNRTVTMTSDWIYYRAYLPPVGVPPTKEEEDVESVTSDFEHLNLKADMALHDYIPRNPYTATLNAIQSVTETNNRIQATVSKVEAIVEAAGKKTGLTSEEEEEASEADEPDGILGSILGWINGIPGAVGAANMMNTVVTISNLVSGFNSYLVATNIITRACSIITIVSELIGNISNLVKISLLELAQKIIRLVSGSEKGNQEPEPLVANAAIIEFIPALVGVLTVAMIALGFKSIPDDKATKVVVDDITTKLRLFNFSASALSNIKTLFKDVKELVNWIMEEMMSMFAPQILAQIKLKNGFGDVERWAAELDALDGINYINQCNYDSDFFNRLMKLAELGEEYNALLLRGKVGREGSIIRAYCQKAHEVKMNLQTARDKLPIRIAPFVISMHGGTNVGKSFNVLELAMDLMDDLGYPKTDRWCPINMTEQYFTENYQNQTSVYMDDFSQFTNDEQYHNFFSLAGNNAYPLRMASLDKKGTYFTSHFIFQTTNTPYPRPNSVTHNVALLRRRNLLIETEWVNPEHAAQSLTGDNSMRKDDHSHLKFRLCHTSNPDGQKSQWMTYPELMTEVKRKGRQHFTNQNHAVGKMLTRIGYAIDPSSLPNAPDPKPRTDLPACLQYIACPTGLTPDGKPLKQPTEIEMQEFCNTKSNVASWKLSVDSCMQDKTLQNFDRLLFENLIYDTATDRYVLDRMKIDPKDLEYLNDEWSRLSETMTWYNRFRSGAITPQELLLQYSYEYNDEWKFVSKPNLLKRTFKTIKDWLNEQWIKCKENFPWISVLETWPVKLGAAIFTIAGVIGLTSKVVHSCICNRVRHYGFRCSVCGKWPKLDNCKHKDWLLKEWKQIYGEVMQYKDNFITSLNEEQDFLTLSSQDIKIDKPLIGTIDSLQAEIGPYSDITKGSAPTKLVAQLGPYNNVTKGLMTQRIIANAGNNQTVNDVLEHRIIPYIYRLKFVKNGTAASMNGFAIGDRKVLIPKHFLDCLKEGEFFEIYHSNVWMPVQHNWNKAIVIKNKDVAIYEMPPQFHIHKNLSKHFISETELGKISRTKAVLVKQTDGLYYTLENTEATAVKSIKYTNDFEDRTTQYEVQNMWKYTATTGPGTCGSVLLTTENKTKGRILGIHACSNNLFSYSQLITREMIESHIPTQLGTPAPIANCQIGNNVPDGHFGRLGTVEKGVYQSDRTTIIPTLIQGLITEPVTAPAVLSSRDPRLIEKKNILKAGVSKYGKLSTPFNERHRHMINEYLHTKMENWDIESTPRVLTEQEAIAGIEGMEGFERMPMDTSPGYPYVLTRPQNLHGKAYLFDIEKSLISDKELRSKYDQREALAKRGERCISVWTNCLKDERRAWQKILTGNTRMFTIPPVDNTILTRKYTLSYSAAVKQNRYQSYSQVGINIHSLEWTQLYNRLAEFSDIAIAGDFSNFDGTIPPDLTQDFYNEIDYFYKTYGEWKEEDSNVRRVICDESIHTVCLSNNELYLTHIGNKSGDGLTVIKNGGVNFRYIALAFLSLAEEYAPELATMEHFEKLVLILDYGDDNLISIKRQIIEWFNQETIALFLEKHNIKYTNSEKNGITKYQPLDTCTFLKNSFGNHESEPGIKVPLMDKNTIYELLNWTRIAPDQIKLLEDNCNDSLKFAYFYGKEFYDNHRAKIMEALKSKNLKLSIRTYTDYHYWFLFTIGKLPHLVSADAFFETISQSGNSGLSQLISHTIEKIPYTLLSWMGILQRTDKTQHTDNRHAIAIPSGEGKTWLCKKYPHVFVDHDELLLPAARRQLGESGLSWKNFWKILKEDFPSDDRRILLVHHPENTNRQILGSYVLPKPSYIRANFYQRLRMNGAKKMEREERNKEILDLALKAEPQLFC